MDGETQRHKTAPSRVVRPIALPERVGVFGVAAGLLALGFGLLIFHSYPMMYPGYDIWWHLGVMQTGAAYDPSMVEYARWHRLWDGIFRALEVEDIFNRALIIHRVQFAITVLAITGASYICLHAVFRRRGSRSLYVFSSFLAAAVWLVMHGTHSSPHFGGEDSAATQSWIMWYSVNYQISLPFYFLATACLLGLVSGAYRSKGLSALAVLGLLSLGGLIYCHLAELPYFLIDVILIVFIFGNSTQKKTFLVLFPLLIAGLLFALPHVSHRIPELPRLLISGDYVNLLHEINEQGDLLVNQGLNRAGTSWNSLYTASLIALLTSFFGLLGVRSVDLNARPLIFIFSTAILPVALFTRFTAGFLALLTNADLAWRFSFGSFLFLGLPVLLVLSILLAHDLLSRLLALVIFAALLWVGRSDVVMQNAASIWRSVSPTAVHFGLSELNRERLLGFSKKIGSTDTVEPLCLDIFSTYYLFYVFGRRDICLPSAISSIPGSADRRLAPENCRCDFERNADDFSRMGVKSPEWSYGF